MKCPRCWTDKAYLRPVGRWEGLLLGLALLRPMRCQHCWHKFLAFWPLTLGKQVRPPKLRSVRMSHAARPSLAAQQQAAIQAQSSREDPADEDRPRRADAA